MISDSEYLPLCPSGFRDINEDDFEQIFVEPFGPKNDRRREMCRMFREWLQAIKGIGISFELWIDGSFATHKPEPGDIDIVCIIDNDDFQVLPRDVKMRAYELLSRDSIKRKYLCHVYPIYKNSKSYDYASDYDYWKDQFGHARSGMSKGIFKVSQGGKT
jgi:hypothetical protein